MDTDRYRVRPGKKLDLTDHDPDEYRGEKLAKEDRAAALAPLTARLAELQELLYADGRHRLLVVLQGMDTAGKDGTIRDVFRDRQPAGRPRRQLQDADRATSWPTTTCGGSTPRPRRTARSPSSTAATTRTCSSSGSTTSCREPVWAPALRPHRRVRADARRRGHHHPQVLPAHLQGRAGRAAPGPPRRPHQELEVRRRRPRRAQALGRLPGRLHRGARRRPAPRPRRGTSCPPTASGTATS